MTDPLHPQQPASGTGRRALTTRRPAIAEKFEWRPSSDRRDWRRIYIRVGFHPLDSAPLEIFLRPTKHASRQGSTLHHYAEDIGEMLSLLLQHGHTLDKMAKRFKSSSLARAAVLAALDIARQEDLSIDGPVLDRLMREKIRPQAGPSRPLTTEDDL